MFKLLLPLFLFSFVYSQDLGEVNISTNVDAKVTQSIANDVFLEPEYIESNSYMPKAPGQKRLTTEEAMFIPGVQGDPVKALKYVGGVSTSAAGGGLGGELYIYGSKPEESLYTINHLPIGYLFHMGGLHSVIAPNAMEQIDAYLAGFDTTYGDAMGGVIDITPKYPDNDLSGYGHIGLFDASAGINVALSDDTAFYFGARRSYFDIFLDKMDDSKKSKNDNTITQFPSYYDATFMFTQKLNDKHMLSIEAITAADEVGISSQEYDERDPLATGNINAQTGFTSVGARWSVDSGNYSGNTLLYYMHNYSDIELYTDYFIKSKSDEIGLFHESTLEYENHKLVFGLEATQRNLPLDMNTSLPKNPDEPDFDFTTSEKIVIDRTIEIKSLSLFLQDIYSLTKDFRVRYGVRAGYSDYQNYGSYLDPRVSLVYDINHQNSISASVGQYTQTPDGFKTTQEMGNVSLTYEQAMHYVLHYDYKYNDAALFSLEPFYKDYNALAIDDNVSNYQNSGDGYAYGVDTSIKYRDGDWYGFLAYTYLRSKRETSTDSDLSDFYAEIPHTLQFVGAKRFAKNWVFSSLMKYSSGALYSPVIGTYNYTDTDGTTRVRPIYGDAYSERLPDYFTLNLKIAQTIKYSNKRSLEWSFEIMNITNHENVMRITYDDNYNETGVVADLPILPWFDVTYRF